nr:2322_t:CDS:2 [Entrophospora candida]
MSNSYKKSKDRALNMNGRLHFHGWISVLKEHPKSDEHNNAINREKEKEASNFSSTVNLGRTLNSGHQILESISLSINDEIWGKRRVTASNNYYGISKNSAEPIIDLDIYDIKYVHAESMGIWNGLAKNEKL